MFNFIFSRKIPQCLGDTIGMALWVKLRVSTATHGFTQICGSSALELLYLCCSVGGNKCFFYVSCSCSVILVTCDQVNLVHVVQYSLLVDFVSTLHVYDFVHSGFYLETYIELIYPVKFTKHVAQMDLNLIVSKYHFSRSY